MDGNMLLWISIFIFTSIVYWVSLAIAVMTNGNTIFSVPALLVMAFVHDTKIHKLDDKKSQVRQIAVAITYPFFIVAIPPFFALQMFLLIATCVLFVTANLLRGLLGLTEMMRFGHRDYLSSLVWTFYGNVPGSVKMQKYEAVLEQVGVLTKQQREAEKRASAKAKALHTVTANFTQYEDIVAHAKKYNLSSKAIQAMAREAGITIPTQNNSGGKGNNNNNNKSRNKNQNNQQPPRFQQGETNMPRKGDSENRDSKGKSQPVGYGGTVFVSDNNQNWQHNERSQSRTNQDFTYIPQKPTNIPNGYTRIEQQNGNGHSSWQQPYDRNDGVMYWKDYDRQGYHKQTGLHWETGYDKWGFNAEEEYDSYYDIMRD